MVGEGAAAVEEELSTPSAVRNPSSSGKKRKHKDSIDTVELESGEQEVNRSTDSEADGQNSSREEVESSSPLLPEAAKVRASGSNMDTCTGRSAVPPIGGRRSSVEAESRIDPGRDEPDSENDVTVSTSKGKKAQAKPSAVVAGGGKGKTAKRQNNNSSRPSGMANGSKVSSSSDSDEEDESQPPPHKKKAVQLVHKATNKVGESTANSSPNAEQKSAKTAGNNVIQSLADVSPTAAPLPKAPVVAGGQSGEKEEFPRVGDLVWGRMAGFPYWPAFVTRSPNGEYRYRKEGASSSSKPSYHVQFFNWNDESGWVTSVIEFDGLEAFQQLGAKKKSDKSFNPAAQLKKKWEKAARDAEDTMGLTRQERIDQYFVSYAHKIRAPMATSPTGGSSAKNSLAAVSPASKSASPARKVSTPLAKSATISAKLMGAGNSSDGSKPCPASKKTGGGQASSGSPRRSGPLPKDWRSETRKVKDKEVIFYISPDGREFQSKAAALRYISQEKGSQGVKYLNDPSLPPGWKCQKVQSSIFFFSPMGERFDSRKKVADRMRADNHSAKEIARVLAGNNSRPAPKSVKISRGEIIHDDPPDNYEDDSEDDSDQIKYLPDNLTKYRYGGPYDNHLDLEKLFDGPNVAGGIIDMVQLPDIFLRHPTVLVQEADNEMTISDVETGEFIAKKIIYD